MKKKTFIPVPLQRICQGVGGFTLLELMAALALIGLIILAANSSELNTRVFLNKELSRFTLLKNASYALSSIVKAIRIASSITPSGNKLILDIYEPDKISGVKVHKIIEYTFSDNKIEYTRDDFWGFSGTLVNDVKSFNYSKTGDLIKISIELEKNDQNIKLESYATTQNK
jgi:prepilin-type N-terminal cleavage/methylation domain-containing protein